MEEPGQNEGGGGIEISPPISPKQPPLPPTREQPQQQQEGPQGTEAITVTGEQDGMRSSNEIAAIRLPTRGEQIPTDKCDSSRSIHPPTMEAETSFPPKVENMLVVATSPTVSADVSSPSEAAGNATVTPSSNKADTPKEFVAAPPQQQNEQGCVEQQNSEAPPGGLIGADVPSSGDDQPVAASYDEFGSKAIEKAVSTITTSAEGQHQEAAAATNQDVSAAPSTDHSRDKSGGMSVASPKDFFYRSFEDQLLKDGLRLGQRHSKSGIQAMVQPLPPTEQSRQGDSVTRGHNDDDGSNSSSCSSRSNSPGGSRLPAGSRHIAHGVSINRKVLESEGSMSERDFGLTASFFAPDDPMNRKHSRLTAELFTVHMEQRTVKTGRRQSRTQREERSSKSKGDEEPQQQQSKGEKEQEKSLPEEKHEAPMPEVTAKQAHESEPIEASLGAQLPLSLTSDSAAADQVSGEWPEQLPSTIPDIKGKGKEGHEDSWPYDRKDATPCSGVKKETPKNGSNQGEKQQDGGIHHGSSKQVSKHQESNCSPPSSSTIPATAAAADSGPGSAQPYRDNMDYFRDQFRLMRMVEDRNKVNRDTLIKHALGADPGDEDLFCEVDREFPVPRDASVGGYCPGHHRGSGVRGSAGSITDILQLVGNGLQLLQSDEEEAARYLSHMWDEDGKRIASICPPCEMPSASRERSRTNSRDQHQQNARQPEQPPQRQHRSQPSADIPASPCCVAEPHSNTPPPTAAIGGSNGRTVPAEGRLSPVSVQPQPLEVGPEDDMSCLTPASRDPAAGGGAGDGYVARREEVDATFTVNSDVPTPRVQIPPPKRQPQRDPHSRSSSVAESVTNDEDNPVVRKQDNHGHRWSVYSEQGRESVENKRRAILANLRQREKVMRAHIRQRLIATWTRSKWIPRLEVLSKAFDLSRFEKMVLVTFVAKHFSKVYLGIGTPASSLLGLGYNSNNADGATATIQDLARSFLSRLTDQMVTPFKYFSPSSPLVRESIITVLHGNSTASGHHPMLQRVAINPSIAEHLLDTGSMHPGARHLDRHLHAQNEGVHEPNTPLKSVILPPKTRESIETAVKNLSLYLELQRHPAPSSSIPGGGGKRSRRGSGTIFLFTGKPGSGKRLLAQAVATELGKKVVWSGRSGRAQVVDLFMQAKMHDAVLVASMPQGSSMPTSGGGSGLQGPSLHGLEENGSEEGAEQPLVGLLRSALEGGYTDWSSFEEEMERHSDLVILIAQSASLLPKPLRRWVSLLVELDEQPDHILRRQLWEVMKPEDFAMADDVDLDALSMKWSFNAGLIKSSWVMAQLFAVLRDGKAPRITQADLHRAARSQLDEKLRMEAPGNDGPGGGGVGAGGGHITGLDSAVLSPPVRESLLMIVNNAKACQVVYGQWGFRPDHAAAAGVRALFWGPPGTGKTHAAHCVSYELGKTLKVANAAQLTSKFVGDTSKNLQKLFREAKESNGVLLFDEAEGLLSERKDQRERHDIEEANLLLQLVESFDGVLIATTNRPDLVDAAFRRRFDIWVEFSEPTEKERSELWRLLFPPQAPIAKDLDFSLLGRRFSMSGGHIKSAVRRAAMRAALRSTKDQVIKMEDLLSAAEEEMKKKEGGNSQQAPTNLYL